MHSLETMGQRSVRGVPTSPAHPLGFLLLGWSQRRLILALAWSEIESRYRGSFLGLLWVFVQPLIMLAVYTLVFSVVFRSRWGTGRGGDGEFALFLFSGLILYAIFAECTNQAPQLIRNHRNYVLQVPFPLAALSWVSLMQALIHFGFALTIFLGAYLWLQGVPPLTWIALPAVLLPLALITLGTSWLISALGVFLEDLSQIVGVLTTALLFLSPVFYPPTQVPESFRSLYLLNPLAHVLEGSKDLLFYGRPPNAPVLALLVGGGWLFAWAAYAFFAKTQKSFADVL